MVRHFKIILSICIATILASCDNSNDYQYKKFGVKFLLPDNWMVTSIDSTEDGAHLINCSAKGDNITKVTITIEKQQLDTTSFGKKVRTYKENMAGFSPSFTNVQTSTFNGISSFKFGFNASSQFISTINAKGYIESFQLKDKTVTVLVMQNANDASGDKTGLDKLLNSIQLDS